jgi:hypothetical protein
MWTLTARATQPILPAMLLDELADFITRHWPAASSLATPPSPKPTATC